MTMWIGVCENGLQTPAIFSRHPKRELHEVHYARCVPTFEDKVAQRAVSMVLEAIYEQDYLPCSYGFRPGRSAHQALNSLQQEIWSKRNTVHFSIFIAFLILIGGRGLSVRCRSGKLLIFRLTQRLLRRCRRDGRRSCRISSSTAL